MKTCFKCQKAKSLDAFYKHPAMKDGYLGKCKECTKADIAANRQAKHAAYHQYDKQRAGLPHRRAMRKRWIEKNPHKHRAQRIIHNEVACGRLKKQPCEICGATKFIHAHHEDYTKPREVRWLCPRHHRLRHLEIENGSKA